MTSILIIQTLISAKSPQPVSRATVAARNCVWRPMIWEINYIMDSMRSKIQKHNFAILWQINTGAPKSKSRSQPRNFMCKVLDVLTVTCNVVHKRYDLHNVKMCCLKLRGPIKPKINNTVYMTWKNQILHVLTNTSAPPATTCLSKSRWLVVRYLCSQSRCHTAPSNTGRCNQCHSNCQD